MPTLRVVPWPKNRKGAPKGTNAPTQTKRAVTPADYKYYDRNFYLWGVKRSGFSVVVENVEKDVCL